MIPRSARQVMRIARGDARGEETEFRPSVGAVMGREGSIAGLIADDVALDVAPGSASGGDTVHGLSSKSLSSASRVGRASRDGHDKFCGTDCNSSPSIAQAERQSDTKYQVLRVSDTMYR